MARQTQTELLNALVKDGKSHRRAAAHQAVAHRHQVEHFRHQPRRQPLDRQSDPPIRAVGPVSEALCRLPRGATVGVRGPYGNHWPVEAAVGSDVVVAAGGIGLAPLRPVLYHLLAQRPAYGNIVLLYGARTPQDLLYTDELARWRGRFDLEVGVTVDKATDGWQGHVGTVTTLIPKARFDPARTVAFVCGPEIMMRFTIRELQTRGVPDERIFISMERNMKCAIGLCGHCQLGPFFICKDGPVFAYSAIKEWFGKREV